MTVLKALREYADTLAHLYASRRGAGEDNLKGPVQTLLHRAGDALGFAVRAKTEARVQGMTREPDLVVEIDDLPIGYLELKPPGRGADPERFRTKHDREQWRDLRDLPNLIYCDGIDWRLFQHGRAPIDARMAADMLARGGAAVDPAHAAAFEGLMRLFLRPRPIVPKDPADLAQTLAPLCRLLRDAVFEAVRDPDSSLARQAAEWRALLFSDADEREFSDAYAQTVTYGLLLRRLQDGGQTDLLDADALARSDNLVMRALRTLTDVDIEESVRVPLHLLRRAVEAVDPSSIRSPKADPWLYFYEDFLGAYDPELRKNRGVYYTPVEVVHAQTALADDVLREDLGKRDGVADAGVLVLDPAVGTGTYLLYLARYALERMRESYGRVSGQLATRLAGQIVGFEIMVGPYAVAHLRLTAALREHGARLPPSGARVYLGDTLESHLETKQLAMGFLYERLRREREEMTRVKAAERVLVCIGNPPYDRQQIPLERQDRIRRKGGWVRDGLGDGSRAILEDFLQPARDAGMGVQLKNLYNDYVYFWRWAIWKVLDSTRGPGVVSFISASSYLRGPAFVGMREYLRRAFDEIWIIDLEGGGLGARKTENVFSIRTPVAIATGIRRGPPSPDTPARVHYARIEGTAEEKLRRLAAINGRRSLRWKDCPSAWQAPLVPEQKGDFFSWPRLTDLFPWQHSGAEYKRNWAIAATQATLERRWEALLRSPDRRVSFRETRDRKIARAYSGPIEETSLPPLAGVSPGAPCPPIVRYAWRTFDRRWSFADGRLGDFLRPALWRARGGRQVYLTGLLTDVLGPGPGLIATTLVPDHHCFSGRGGKDAIPLWRDRAATDPNLAPGLLDRLAHVFRRKVAPEDLLAYVYALLATRSYTERFAAELEVPGPRVPMTADRGLFARAATLGRELICWHTFGENFRAPGFKLAGKARCRREVPQTPDRYPERFEYDPAARALHVGDGTFAPVAPEVWEWSVSGLRPAQSWLAYRMREGAGKKSSPLDAIREDAWPASFTLELLELLWVLEATTRLRPRQDRLLEQVLAGPLVAAAELPRPAPDAPERRAPDDAGAGRAQEPLLPY